MSKKSNLHSAYRAIANKYGSRHRKKWSTFVKTRKGGKLSKVGKLSKDHR